MKAKIALCVLILIGVFGTSYNYNLWESARENSKKMTSPLPELLVQKSFAHDDGSYYWKPNLNLHKSLVKLPNITALSAISYDISSDTLIYQKSIDTKLPMASLTKLMTAIVALENMDVNTKIQISHAAASIGENSMGVTEGEVFTLHDLLYGLFLHSGNDAAEAIAQSSQFGRNNFVYLMNKKAEYLGLTDTYFTNPSGLEGDGKQYTTVLDLLAISRYGLQNPYFAKVTSTVEKVIPQTTDHKRYELFNETNLLTSYPGVKGLKTGFTYEAGMCLATYLEYDGHKIIAILLNSGNRRQEMKDLLDFSLRSLGVKPPPHD